MARTLLLIDVSHPALAGHFPARPVVPGVLLLDAARAEIERQAGRAVQGLVQVKFLAAAAPGERLEIECELAAEAAGFRILCGERLMASGRFTLAGGT